MTPKEKAISLYKRYIDIYKLNKTDPIYISDYENAKYSAFIAVDEILNEYDKYLQSFHTHDLSVKYWQEVKEEIEKL